MNNFNKKFNKISSANLFVYAFVFLITIPSASAQTPIAKLSSSPVAIVDTIKICQGQSVVFSNNSDSTISQTSYSWTFGSGAVPTSQSGIGPYTVSFTAAVAATVSLSVNNNNGKPISIKTMIVLVSPSPVSTITLNSSGGGFGSATQNGFTVFKFCNATDSTSFSFKSNYNASFNQIFNWGNGNISSNVNLSGQNIAHTFPIGQFDFIHTVTLPNACSVSKQYIVFNGSAPFVTVSGAGQNTCLPSPYSYDLISNKVPITYTISFTDGTAPTTFNTAKDTTIAHIFNSSSCGVNYVYATGLPPIPNAFSSAIVAQNFCSNNGIPTVLTIGPINISKGTTAKFNSSPLSPICKNETVKFINVSKGGEAITSTACDSTYSFYWKMVESTGYVITAGTLGSANSSADFTNWTSGSNILDIQFDSAATYHLWIYTANSCGKDSFLRDIIVKPFSTVLVSPNPVYICSGDSTPIFTLTSTIPGYNINWDVLEQKNVSDLSPANGFGPSPLIIPRQRLLNTSDSLGFVKLSSTVGCSNEPKGIITIWVKPTAKIITNPDLSTICSGTKTNIDISSNLANINFSWTVQSPLAITGASAGAGNKIAQTLYNASDTALDVTYTIVIVNDTCSVPFKKVTVTVLPGIKLVKQADVFACPNKAFNAIVFSTNQASASITWVNSNTLVGLSASGIGNIPSWKAPSNTSNSPIVASVIVAATIADCPAVYDTFLVTLNNPPKFSSTLFPNSGLDCVFKRCTIIGSSMPNTCKFVWTGPLIISGDSSSSPKIGAPGVYEVTLTDTLTGCSIIENITIDPPTEIAITQVMKDDVRCYGDSNGSIQIETNTVLGSVSYTWMPLVSTSKNAANLKPGFYKVIVLNVDGCADSVTTEIKEPLPIKISLIDSLRGECGEANGQLFVSAQGGIGNYSYSWSNGKNGSQLKDVDAGIYTVTVTDDKNCKSSETYPLSCVVLVPIVVTQFISPNNDQQNDIWTILHLDLYPQNSVKVFNRWGNLVFQAEPYKNDWDGTASEGLNRNGALPAGTYLYLIDTKKKSQEIIKGFLEIQP
jgi:gliding motility-associated-like protein